MWLKAGLDLRCIHYKAIATAHEVGWIEIVRHSVTTANIHKESGGFTGVFNEKSLANWLRKHNPSGTLSIVHTLLTFI